MAIRDDAIVVIGAVALVFVGLWWVKAAAAGVIDRVAKNLGEAVAEVSEAVVPEGVSLYDRTPTTKRADYTPGDINDYNVF